MTLEYVRLTIEAEINSTQRTGVFEWAPAAEGAGVISGGIRTGTIVESGGQAALALLSRLSDQVEARGQAIRVSGGGQLAFQLEAETPTTGTKPNGDTFQWGSDPDPTVGPNAHTATGADKEAQQAVLLTYLSRSDGDSFTPATLEFFEYSSNGFLDPLSVALEDPEVSIVNDDPTAADISMTAVSVLDLEQALTQRQRQP
ncbi:hypothetical protein [Halobaculum sp. EA56]|uniref:hypothetical protein n=1 Tax=Halobaculum sp. EA56 TaxID=3421648 RepID=UPI003EBA90D2